jgi:hypothetical protein
VQEGSYYFCFVQWKICNRSANTIASGGPFRIGTSPGNTGGGGGSRTPVREALPPEDYMLSPFRQRLCPDGKPHVRHGNSERARRTRG